MKCLLKLSGIQTVFYRQFIKTFLPTHLLENLQAVLTLLKNLQRLKNMSECKEQMQNPADF